MPSRKNELVSSAADDVQRRRAPRRAKNATLHLGNHAARHRELDHGPANCATRSNSVRGEDGRGREVLRQIHSSVDAGAETHPDAPRRSAPAPIYSIYMDDPKAASRAKIFWSGGSQALRLPKAMRLPGSEAVVRRRGRCLVVEPVAEQEGWDGFWDRLVPLKDPVKRWPTAAAEKRRRV